MSSKVPGPTHPDPEVPAYGIDWSSLKRQTDRSLDLGGEGGARPEP